MEELPGVSGIFWGNEEYLLGIKEEISKLDIKIKNLNEQVRQERLKSRGNSKKLGGITARNKVQSKNLAILIKKLNSAKIRRNKLEIFIKQNELVKQRNQIQERHAGVKRTAADISGPAKRLKVDNPADVIAAIDPLIHSDQEKFLAISQSGFSFIKHAREYGYNSDDAQVENRNALALVQGMNNINIRSDEGSTVLHYACAAGMKDLIIILLMMEVEVVKDNQGDNPLHSLFSNSSHSHEEQLIRLKICKSLISKYPDIINEKNEAGVSPLIKACQSGDLESVKYFLECGAVFDDDIISKISLGILLRKDMNGNEFIKYLMANEKFVEPTFAHLGKLLNLEVEDLKEISENIGFDKLVELLDKFSDGEEVEIVPLRHQLDMFKKYINISKSIDQGSVTDFEDFLNQYPPPSNFEVQDFVATIFYVLAKKEEPLSAKWQLIKNVTERYYQISQVEIEKGGIPSVDNLKIAFLIEDVIKKMQVVSDRFFKKWKSLPRSLAISIEKGESIVYVLSKSELSLIKGKGSFKSVKSALRIKLEDLSAKTERVVYAKMKKKEKSEAIEAEKEHRLIEEFSEHVGFGKSHKFLCFDSDGNEIKRSDLRAVSSYAKVRPAIVLEEFECGELKAQDVENLNQEISIASQLLLAIHTAHSRNKAIWDIKLPNILFKKDHEGNIKVGIMDLGLMVETGEDKKAHQYYGSPAFSPPELLYQVSIAHNPDTYLHGDIWALGLILYEIHFKKPFPMLDAKLAYYGDYAARHNLFVERPLTMLTAAINEGSATTEQKFEFLILNMLKIDPVKRITPAQALEEIDKM